MNKKLFFVLLIGLSYLLLRFDILLNLPIASRNLGFNLLLSILNSILIYSIARKYLDFESSLFSVFVFISSPLIAYYEFSSSVYLTILTCLLITVWIFLKKKPIYFLASCLIFVLILIFFSGVTLYSDPGLINSINQLRGESVNMGVLPKAIENRAGFFSLHFAFNLLKQFSPVVYFTPEYKILGFSFSPPLLTGFMITAFFGLIFLVKNIRNFYFAVFTFTILVLPSALSKNAPDLERLIIAVPAVSMLCGYGFSKAGKIFKILVFTFIIFQFILILFDISLREPARMVLFK